MRSTTMSHTTIEVPIWRAIRVTISPVNIRSEPGDKFRGDRPMRANGHPNLDWEPDNEAASAQIPQPKKGRPTARLISYEEPKVNPIQFPGMRLVGYTKCGMAIAAYTRASDG